MATSRPVVLADGSTMLCIGGLAPTGAHSTSAIWRVNPTTGRVTADGSLVDAVHDAGGAVLRGQDIVFGGGGASVDSTVQLVSPGRTGRVVGHLPTPRADLVAVGSGGAAYVAGGFDGRALSGTVLRTTDGQHFADVAALAVPVRYPAVVAVPHAIYLFGGERGGALTDVVQRINLASGMTTVVAHLPIALGHAGALVLDGTILVAGGKTRLGSPPVETTSVLAFDPARGTFRRVGSLPRPASDFGTAVVGGVGYLLGGENAENLSTIVEIHGRR
ncbi:hypothetical protein [Leekyejoonella antrihumi]|uniref:hypothetical protein n=1 Tax=Leekyejoonella antrihumi TaxID=1660198 RepID=UPI0016440EA3|nr:hypothetical protein [Leekyejoonella antrihumi]